MSSAPSAALGLGEEMPLQPVPGSGLQPGRTNDTSNVPYKVPHKDYKKLAICSIICGISCIGIFALISSVKARERRLTDPERAQTNANKARRLAVMAISLWVGLLLLIPALMALASYLITLRN